MIASKTIIIAKGSVVIRMLRRILSRRLIVIGFFVLSACTSSNRGALAAEPPAAAVSHPVHSKKAGANYQAFLLHNSMGGPLLTVVVTNQTNDQQALEIVIDGNLALDEMIPSWKEVGANAYIQYGVNLPPAIYKTEISSALPIVGLPPFEFIDLENGKSKWLYCIFMDGDNGSELRTYVTGCAPYYR